ncbi:hypothetical protein HanXRQr2_Chr07g0294581 [Helianthus annuus]|uniref:Uncharacterized protein n=1 Tax=Helianthus annuus TaxID=4232 RepID=A0A9K3ILI4_HELAN|nr:hypothetical protein HanXRQr2_Chr07g0294581 [Helianthus annuus]KAJ0904689.1 hypothetical protein HanPSC8_Chr07g0285181 [Helianthus annuus]
MDNMKSNVLKPNKLKNTHPGVCWRSTKQRKKRGQTLFDLKSSNWRRNSRLN